jgi:putative DNA primase/helicase
LLGRASGTPIVLGPLNDGLGLGITEGLEDGLSVRAANELGVWAAGSATLMPALADAVPAYIECVTIYQHDDEAGRSGSVALAQRLVARGIQVRMAQAQRA